MKLINFIILFIVLAPSLKADIVDTSFQSGIEAFEQKQYTEAAKYFELAINNGIDSPAIYYNLGTTYLHANQYGKARYYLEKAYLLAPFDSAIQQNLEILRDRIKTTIIPLEPFFLKKWWHNFSNLASPVIWSLLCILFLILTTLSLYSYWFKGNTSRKHLTLTILLSLMSCIALIAGISRYQFIHNSGIIIIQNTTELRSSASENSKSIKLLSPGVKLNHQETFKDWIKVNTEDLEVGWVKVDKTLAI